MDDTADFLPTDLLREPRIKLRDIDRESIQFMELRDSIREKGILNSILVRPVGDHYEIIDGLCRYTAAKEVGLTSMPCIVRECSDDEVMALQLQANAIWLETKLADYALRIKQLMQRNPDMTIRQVACLIRKSPPWVGQCLGLLNLRKEIQRMVDRSEIPAGNAYMLAKIPRSMQMDYVDDAKTMPTNKFRPLAAGVVKQFREAVKQGKMEAYYQEQIEPVAHLRSLKDIEEEMKRRGVGALICTSDGCQNALDGFYAGLRWVCHLDRDSVQEQEAIIRSRRGKELVDVTDD